jgi:hypothetical protein
LGVDDFAEEQSESQRTQRKGERTERNDRNPNISKSRGGAPGQRGMSQGLSPH